MKKNARKTQGKFYTIKSKTACIEEGISHTPLPKGVAGHMVVVLSQPDSQNKVKFATITSKPCGDIEYYPIAPTPRRPYRFQLHLCGYNNQFFGPPTALPLYSYLRVEEHVVSLEMLEEVEGDYGEHLALKSESANKLVSAFKAKQSAPGSQPKYL